MRNAFYLLFCLILVSETVPSWGSEPIQDVNKPRTLLLSLEKLQKARAAIEASDRDAVKMYKNLMRRSAPFLEMKTLPSVVNNDYVAPGGTKNDYVSFSTYYWPDPEKPDGLPYILLDGKKNTDWLRPENGHDWDDQRKMVAAVKTLTLAGYLGDKPSNTQAIRILRHWFLAPETRMNPHLRYSQSIRGRNTGTATGIIDTHVFPDLVEMLGLLEASPDWTPKDRTEMKHWFSDFLDWLLESDFGKRESKAVNNHGTWYDVQVISYAWYASRDDIARKMLEKSKQRIDSHIEKDGRQLQELRRTLPFIYSIMNLRAVMRLAHYGESYDIDLWSYRGARDGTIRAAYDFLLPYAEEKERWPYEDLNFKPTAFDAILRLTGERFGASPQKLNSLNRGYDFDCFIR